MRFGAMAAHSGPHPSLSPHLPLLGASPTQGWVSVRVGWAECWCGHGVRIFLAEPLDFLLGWLPIMTQFLSRPHLGDF